MGYSAAVPTKSAYAPRLVAECLMGLPTRGGQPLTKSLEEMLGGAASAGYPGIELPRHFFEPAFSARTAAALQMHRLAVPVVSSGGVVYTPEHAERSITETLQVAGKAKLFGLKALSFNPAPKRAQERKTDQELAFQALAIDRLADELHKRGLRLFIFQNGPEMTENAREWRHVLIHTNHKLVEFCLDILWVHRGRQDVITLLGECGSRLADLHLRPFRDGGIDYHALAARLRQTGFHGYLTVEPAITQPMIDTFRLSREYTEKAFGIM